MSGTSHVATTRTSRLSQVRRTALNTIVEDVGEQQSPDKDPTGHRVRSNSTTMRLEIKTEGLPVPPVSRGNRFVSPLSASSISSCSDKEWQSQVCAFDDLYDATDDETEMSDEFSLSSTRPTSLATPITRTSTVSTASRNRYPSITIPKRSIWPSLQRAHKSSPIPPTPPPKISVSSTTLSLLSHSVPGLHEPPSLDGSQTSDQISNISSPATPDLRSLPDNDWSTQEIHVRPVLEDNEDGRLPNNATNIDVGVEVPIQHQGADWPPILGDFARIPWGGEPTSDPTMSQLGNNSALETAPSEEALVLPEDALAVLRSIPLDGTPDPWSETSEKNDEMWQLQPAVSQQRGSEGLTPASALSAYSFTSLSIPSPGGFFASLAPRARHTWSLPNFNNPPSSATAESFYNCSWNPKHGEVVEQVIECPYQAAEDGLLTAVPPRTAIRISVDTNDHTFDQPGSSVGSGVEIVNEISRPEIAYEYDENYDEELRGRAIASLDRTSVWLDAQASYLVALCDTSSINQVETRCEEEKPECPSTQVVRQKSVRFADLFETTIKGPSASASKHSIYWRGFQAMCSQSTDKNCFIHRNTRFDAVQSVRLGLLDKHINCLLGKYEIVRHERPPYKGPFSQAPRNSVLASVLKEKADFLKLEKEQIVLSQLQQSMWAIDALKYLNGGRLVLSPAYSQLANATAPLTTLKAAGKRYMRALDLGGHPTCEWAWHLAYEFPNVKIYTVFTKGQRWNSSIRGPSNHRQVSIPDLWKLPFRDNHFDLISARSLHALLKAKRLVGEGFDEYDLCLKECYRCLKPGGYLEFFVMDAEITRAGPYGSATSVEFAFNLRTRGYDPIPTKSFLPRLRKDGFCAIKRAWMFLPMGVEPAKPQLPRETPDPNIIPQTHQCEAVQGPVGSTADIASVTGLLGGWIWEQWLLKLQMEMGHERQKLLDGIGIVFDEGRKKGAGWTCLSGWAMKPKRKRSSTVGFHGVA